jgi:hypothetical protein
MNTFWACMIPVVYTLIVGGVGWAIGRYGLPRLVWPGRERDE